jgi:hypothetical protein
MGLASGLVHVTVFDEGKQKPTWRAKLLFALFVLGTTVGWMWVSRFIAP